MRNLWQKYERAVRKRDKWAAKAKRLELLLAEDAVAAPLVTQDPMRGVSAEVARNLGMSHNHVHEVALGRRKSARVSAAIQEEIAKREAAQ